MATKPDIFAGNVSQVAGYSVSEMLGSPWSTSRTLGSNRIRTLRTMVTDADLEASEFMVATRLTANVVDRSRVFRRDLFKIADESEYFQDGWLVHRPANHAKPLPSWLSDFDRRIEELHEFAREEELPFSEDSAAAARAFCEHHGRSIRPSIFLVGNGNTRLVWENSEDEQIGLQFRADRARVQCILFKRRDDGIAAITAMETRTGLIDLLIGNRLLHLLGNK